MIRTRGSGTSGNAEFRADIQGLRAIAVAAVLVSHVFPNILPGGYVGVDVFFVISGYLMTVLLLREARATGRISLLGFYARRVRRLLPAATVVLLAIALAIPLMPEVRWEETVLQIAASALYVENWRLAWLAVDYFGAESALSPVQHFWSLSVEEQFYIFWPVLIVAGTALATRRRHDLRRTLFWCLSTVVVISLAASIIMTEREPETAYFATYTRVWEFGLGGLVAFLLPIRCPERSREALRVIGLAAIGAAIVRFSANTAFPGYAALLPTLGTALVIIAGPGESNRGTHALLQIRPLQYIGDTSYSIYLWHWPILVFGLTLVREDPSTADRLIIVAATFFLAHLSKTLVEDPSRTLVVTQPIRSLAFGAASILVCILCLSVLLATQVVNARKTGASPPDADRFMPALVAVKRDLPVIYKNGCHVEVRHVHPHPCDFGDRSGPIHIVLAGDSHAAQWMPALEALAERRGWRLTTQTKSGCPLLKTAVALKGQSYDACFEWGKRVLAQLETDRPDIVILSQSAGARVFGDDFSNRAMPHALDVTWRHLQSLGTVVIVILDTPKFSFDPSECLSRDGDCAADRQAVLRPDPIPVAQAMNPRVGVVDMTDQFCGASLCPAAMERVVIWRDRHHLTATYSHLLAAPLERKIEAVLRTREAPKIWRAN